MAEILDSGTRKEFQSGAVRDVQEGKGRCDLLPLGEVAEFLNSDWTRYQIANDPLICLDMFLFSKDSSYVYIALHTFARNNEWNDCTLVLEVSKHFEDGARKYGERNWEKGIPLSRYVDSAIRHYIKWLRGDDDEPHDRAFAWNLLCLLWTMNNRPECVDLWENGYGDG